MKKLLASLALVTALCGSAWAGSTVVPTVPAQNSPLSSAVVRNNFAATYNDINNILGKFAGPTAPVIPTPMQDWVDTSGGTVYAFRFWNPTTATWVTWGTLNTSTGVFSAISAANFAATSPITVSFGGGIVTYGFDLTVANTFLASQTVQAIAANSPSWLAKVTGDAQARARFGTNTAGIAGFSLGDGTLARDVIVERAGVANLRFGSADSASPIAQTLSLQNVVAGTTNVAGAALTINGSVGTGTGVGGSIIFQVAPAGGSGNAQNALVNGLTIFGTGGLSTGAAADQGAGTLNLSGGSLYNNGTAPTGTGAYARAIGPSFTTPSLGAATATSINGITITASSGTLTLNTNTLALSGSGVSLTLAGTGSTTQTFPTTSATLARTDTGQTFTGNNTFNGNTSQVGFLGVASASADCFDVGLNGAANPAFKVDCSTALQVGGVKVTGAVTGGTTVIAAIDSGATAHLQISAKGAGGNITIGGVGNGTITLTGANGGGTNISLGTAGQSGAAITVAGASSGSQIWQTASAASGTATMFAGTDTVAGKTLANGGTNNALTASNGGIVYSDASKLNILAGTATANQCLLSGSNAAPSWGSCAGGASVTSIAGNTGAFTLSTGITNSVNDIRIDKATSANLEAGTSNKVLTADNIYDAEVALSFSATPTWDFNTFLNASLTLTANITTLTCSNMKASQSGVITLTQDGTGSRTMVAGWCSQFRWANGSRGVLSTAAGAVDTLFYQCRSSSICLVSLSKAQAN